MIDTVQQPQQNQEIDYSQYVNSSLDLSEKMIEPASKDSFDHNTRDLQWSNIGPETEFYLLKLNVLVNILKHYEEKGLFPEGFHTRYIQMRDTVLLLAKSRYGFNLRLQKENTIRQYKTTEDRIEPSKPIFFKNNRNNEDNNKYY